MGLGFEPRLCDSRVVLTCQCGSHIIRSFPPPECPWHRHECYWAFSEAVPSGPSHNIVTKIPLHFVQQSPAMPHCKLWPHFHPQQCYQPNNICMHRSPGCPLGPECHVPFGGSSESSQAVPRTYHLGWKALGLEGGSVL